ncbi:uncharacterized protein I206_100434 [Kwoniella pini CBS 10737]|uniref:Uncharacterized protein n=1 Tax=Kwoniella pini CBS 10737 TaxID=1296096 RepID=A0A1B9ID45_9TREE|nr:uncharacterized protein I206_00893 [Kwoniella pini CBS 10737]OCF53588.1 hypothetical protein I206_00893 [Kwoniella pini CBS 10737]
MSSEADKTCNSAPQVWSKNSLICGKCHHNAMDTDHMCSHQLDEGFSDGAGPLLGRIFQTALAKFENAESNGEWRELSTESRNGDTSRDDTAK